MQQECGHNQHKYFYLLDLTFLLEDLGFGLHQKIYRNLYESIENMEA
jgi:hypothetical protein